MSNQIMIPKATILNFVEVDPTVLPQYLSKHMDDWWFKEQHNNQYADYKQKWLTVDAVTQQIEVNFEPVQVDVLNCEGDSVLTQTATVRRMHKYISGFKVMEFTISWATFDPGIYFVVLTLGNTAQKMVSEPQYVNAEWPGTMLVQWSHSYGTGFGDVLWDTGYFSRMRVEAILRDYDPSIERTSYRDQRWNPTILKSIPYNAWQFSIGINSDSLQSVGVPDWVAQKMNWAFACDETWIDGKLYGVLGDGKLEREEIDPVYPLAIWNVDVQEGINRASKIVDVTADTNARLIVGMPTETILFGDTSEQAGSNLIIVQDTE